jgi:BspA type Leucine rich repeat region (6 copies)
MKSAWILSFLCHGGLAPWVARPVCVLLILQLFSPSRVLGAEEGDFVFELDGVGARVAGYRGGGGAVAIPERLGGLPVITIGDGAFLGNTSLTRLTIPNSVTSIGQFAFTDCTSLTSITIPNSVRFIGKVVFWGCTSLTSVTIPDSVTSIGDYAFSSCTSLENIDVDVLNSAYALGVSCLIRTNRRSWPTQLAKPALTASPTA